MQRVASRRRCETDRTLAKEAAPLSWKLVDRGVFDDLGERGEDGSAGTGLANLREDRTEMGMIVRQGTNAGNRQGNGGKTFNNADG